MSDQYTVRENRDNGRVLFTGNEDDARTFVQNHFPRVHNEPGNVYADDDGNPIAAPSDVVLCAPGQNRDKGASFNGSAWSDDEAKDEPRTPRKAAAKKAPAKAARR